jgi:hypothetical protein
LHRQAGLLTVAPCKQSTTISLFALAHEQGLHVDPLP